MRSFLGLLALTTLLVGGGGYWFVRTHPEALPLQTQLLQFEHLKAQVHQIAEQVKQRGDPAHNAATSPHPTHKPVSRPPQMAPTPTHATSSPSAKPTTSTPSSNASFQPAPLVNPVTLYLTNGGVVTGEFVRETPQEVTLRWDYGEAGFQRAEIQRVVKGQHDTDEHLMVMPWEGQAKRWPYQHDVVVKLMNGTIVDAKISAVTPTTVVLTQAVKGGGQIEQTIQRKAVDQLLFRPIHNERSEQIKQNLATIFPKMHWYDEGMFTIVTDSIPPAVKDYRRTIRELATEWYLTFYPLVKDRTPTIQQHVVIFDNWISYIDYAQADGVPGWLAVGYFQPKDQVLYTFNMLGEWFSSLLEEAYLGQLREARDRVSRQIEGSRYAIFIEGQMSEFLQKFETAHAMVRQIYQQVSMDTLRHELTHSLFANWRLQLFVLSQLGESDKEKAQKKHQYLEASDAQKKRELLDELLRNRKGTAEVQDVRASNAWFVEGLAGYMEPSPVGGVNQERLAEIQEARTHGQILPLEFLNVFRLGSFNGMVTQSKLYAYAQSWAFCHFLMQRYPEGFLAFLDRMAREQPKDQDEELAWFLHALGKEQRPLEQEFLVYLDQFPPEDPVWLKQKQLFLDLRAELITLVNRLWVH